MESHFGRWVKKFRNRLGMTQAEFASALGLESYMSVGKLEQRSERRISDWALERLLEIAGFLNEDQLDAAWKAGEMPDTPAMRAFRTEAATVTGETSVQVDGIEGTPVALPPDLYAQVKRLAINGDVNKYVVDAVAAAIQLHDAGMAIGKKSPGVPLRRAAKGRESRGTENGGE